KKLGEDHRTHRDIQGSANADTTPIAPRWAGKTIKARGHWNEEIPGKRRRLPHGSLIIFPAAEIGVKATCGIRPMAKDKMLPRLAQVLKVNNSPPWRHSPQR